MATLQGVLLVCLLVVLQRLAGLVPSAGRVADALIWLVLALILLFCLLGKAAH